MYCSLTNGTLAQTTVENAGLDFTLHVCSRLIMLALARRLGRLGSAGPPLHPEGALPLLLDSLLQLRQAHVARDYRGDDDWQQRRRQRPEPFDSPADELLDEPEPQLRLPDLETIHKLNPQLHDVMLQHQALQK